MELLMRGNRLLVFVLIVMLMLGSLPGAAAQGCNPAAYVERVIKDVSALSALMDSLDRSSPAELADAYIQAGDYRRAYEDLALIPECALVLHALTVQWFAANQDEAAITINNGH